ncbi:hypothetical protein [Antarcticimicrobium luteum]|uniref:DUF2946 domain-containing protein n=1 Tax=Antarcticimicrobium luteum TaxID=2547397 RepID=A0A4V3ARH9_9RHOB|nr:hypothetical protein [Antarcticimicrobium luteum]TDK46737.1 hypothetical protein E1832_11575 [Antarcticimicrobium luteum]
MTRLVPRRLFEAALIALFTVALAAAALAHRAPDRSQAGLAAVQASLGVAVDLCGAAGGSGGTRGQPAPCQFCQIASNAFAPATAGDPHPVDTVLLAEIVPPDFRRAEAQALDPIRLARAPPRI